MAVEPASKKARMEVQIGVDDTSTRFHHVQIYVKNIKPMNEYKVIEDQLNQLANQGSFDPFSGGMKFLEPKALPERVKEGRKIWEKVAGKGALDPEKFSGHGQDIVEQLIIGLGWRVTAEYDGKSTRSVLVCSKDARGQKMVITAPKAKAAGGEPYDHFSIHHLNRFYERHGGRDGIAVLGFEVNVGSVHRIYERYQAKHPSLVIGEPVTYTDTRTIHTPDGTTTKLGQGSMTVLDVLAYYEGEIGSAPDQGTVLRFVERTGVFGSTPGFANPQGVLPGLKDVQATFDGTSIAAYSDHWVSNVVSRVSFLDTLKDTLGFSPKVDFNAGVVAAGEAIIESTVTGNSTTLSSADKEVVLQDQSQVYLPTNNALSEIGHVHGFIRELGQGVQHLACRVTDLISFIERVNNYRKITGRGFAFLRIPRSYYGRLTEGQLIKAGVSKELASAVLTAAQKKNLVSVTGITDLDITVADVEALEIPTSLAKEFEQKKKVVAEVVLRSRYSNLYGLLRDHLNEGAYLQIVRNQILVDIQGNDILYQIFTGNILQRNAGEEAPFLEFIQRVCAECKNPDGTLKPLRPGCGGFGIRNFLTLFLSIEVSKAMHALEEAVKNNDKKAAELAQKQVDAFTNQLDESNPILTEISDAMTLEAEALEKADAAKNPSEKASWAAEAAKQKEIKEQGSEKLKVVSTKYKELMKQLRTCA
eukprot:Sspe_Gene.30542::Locus_15103_Transcript_1_1_Confidence_1.000_Length_2305::g.30542::m.30542